MRWLGERHEGDVIGFDTETEGFQWWRMNCRLVQFGDTMTGWAIPFERWGGVVEEVFRRYEGDITGHNIRFDQRFMYHHGIDVGLHRCHDGMLMANALWPDQRMDLKGVSSRQLDVHAADGQAALSEFMSGGGWTWATVPVDAPQYWAYGALDAVLSSRLHAKLKPQLITEGVNDVYELECAVSNVLFKMETRGARINLPFCEQKYDELLTYSTNLRKWCQENYGCSPGSNDEVISRLQKDGVTFTKRTPSGKKFALDEEVLSVLADEHPLAQTVLFTRKSEKIARAYFRNFVELADGDMLHCSIRQVGAKTGRMSITEPALQTLPRDNKIVRNAFIPMDGNKLVTIDYEQVEMRIFAHFSGEQEMLRRIASGINMHTAVAQVIFNTEEVTKEMYAITKNANFAKVFGAGLEKFAWTAHIPVPEAESFLKMYDTTFPGVKRFQYDVVGVARQRLREEGKAYVRSASGRLHVADENTLYKLVNYLVQGSAADVFKASLVRLDMAGFGDYMVLPIHDEEIFDFPAANVQELTAEAASLMENLHEFKVPLTVDASAPLDMWEKT